MSSVSFWPTKKIKEVLENHYFCSDIGTDFFDLKEELKSELWKRQDKENELRFKKHEKELIEFELYLESIEQ